MRHKGVVKLKVNENSSKKIRFKLIALRGKKEMTQHDIAERVGISRSFYTQIEQGTRNPSVQVLLKMSEIFQVPIEDFFSS